MDRKDNESVYQNADGYGSVYNHSSREFVRLHRLVWEKHNGAIPAGMLIDHIDGDVTNNDISNLRLATKAENNRNCRNYSSNRTGFKGLRFQQASNTQCWRGEIRAMAVRKTSASQDMFEVIGWLIRIRKELHGQFARIR